MKVSAERLPESQVVLQIEVDDARVEKAKESAYRRLASKARIRGFRPGKAPRQVIERHLGEHAVLHEAIDRMLPDVYKEALEQEELDPVDQAAYEMVTEEPLVVKFTVPVRPTVELGDYQDIRVPKDAVSLEPDQVQEGLEALRRRYATLEPVSRPIAWGDIVRADVHGSVDGTAFVQEKDTEFRLQEGQTVSLPGFSEALVGREKGDEFEFDLTVPDDAPDEEMRGQQARYQVTLKEIKQEVLPELDDEFARQVGEGFDSLEALRTRVAEDLTRSLEEEAEHRYHDAIVDALVQLAELDYPPVLVEREVERLLREQLGMTLAPGGRRQPASEQEELERHLRQIGKSEEEMREELRTVADQRIRRSLVLSQLEVAEDIHVSDGEVEAEIERLSSGAGTQADEVRRLFSGESGKESLRRSLSTKATLERLAQIASEQETTEEAQAGESKDG